MDEDQNASETVEWSGERVARWLKQAAGLERQLEPVSDVLFAAAALRPGEHVLDIGCGHGPTTRRAALTVGSAGSVTAVDVSAEMLAAAAAVPEAKGSAPIEWISSDVQDWTPGSADHDVVISRFGVMFFTDPTIAFANMAAAIRPGGRLAIAVWSHRDRSPLFQVPLDVTTAALEERGHHVEDLPVDEGAFSLGDPARATEVLEAAGWSDVVTTEHPMALPFAGGLGPDDAAKAAFGFGPTRVVTTGLPEDESNAVIAALAEAFGRDHLDSAGHVTLEALPQIITARRTT